MKRSTKLALTLVLAAGTVVPALAQDNFPDVPANHWAYEALARMKKDGLLVGYPDGLYRGGRPASRYELAVAMHAVYTNLKNITDGLDAQIQALKGPNNNADIQALKDAVAALQADLAAMKGYGDDIAALKRAAETFDRELKSLGVDVEAMKKDLADLAGRVSALEKKKPSVEITGDVNLLMLAGHSTDNLPGLSKDGRLEGVTKTGALGGLQQDLNLLHEGAFTFTGTNTSGVKWTGTAVVGNMISDGFGGDSFGSQSTLPAGRYSDSVSSDVYLQNLEASFGTEAFGLGFDVKVGRLRTKVSPYLFQRIDNTSYYSNERWDDGKYSFDGLQTDFRLFGAKIDAFGGRTSERYSVNGVDINQVVLGNNRVPGGALGSSDEFTNVTGATSSSDVDRVLGVTAAFPLTKVGNVSLAYLWLDSDNEAGTGILGVAGSDRVEVYGGDADFTFGRIKLSGGYHKSDINQESNRIIDGSQNFSWDAKVGVDFNRLNVYAGYREIGADYIAPGDWGRLGVLRNPGNIHGWQFGGSFNINNALVLSGTGEIDNGFNRGSSLTAVNPFDGDTEIQNYGARLDYKLSSNVSIYGSYESTRFKDLTFGSGLGDTPWYQFTGGGVAYGLSSNAKLNIAYEYSDVTNEAFVGVLGNGNRYRGGLLTTQLTIKF